VDFCCFHQVFTLFSSSSQWVPQHIPSQTSLYPICFAELYPFDGPVCPWSFGFSPTSSFWNSGKTLELYVWSEYFYTGGVSKVCSIVCHGQIKETHAKLNSELQIHNEQINKNHTKYGILVSLAKEKAQPSSHLVILLQNHPRIVSVMVYHHHRLVMVVDRYT
jgi:hypothetical protein